MENSYQHSTIAKILEDIISQINFEGESHSNIADILLSILNHTPYDKEPYSVLAELFLKLKAKIEGEPFDPYDKETHSVIADILLSILNETEYTDLPQSRIAELLLELKEELESYTEITVSGSIVSFTTNVAKPLVKLETNIVAIQSGSGDPYPAGGGKNKCNAQIRASSLANGITSQVYADNRITASGQSSGNGDIGINLDTDLVLESGKTYTISLTGTVTRTSALPVYLRVKGGSYTSPVSMPVGRDSVTISNISGTFDRILIRVTNTQTITMDAKIQVEEGSSATSYAPYENICPITGWSGANVTRCGVNIWNGSVESGDISVTVNGADHANANRMRTVGYVRVKPNTSYNWALSTSYANCIVAFYDKDQNYPSNVQNVGWQGRPTSGVFTTPSWCYYIRFYFNATSATYNNDISINYPSTDTAYHAYNGTTVTLQFGTTIYGGSIDWTSGVVRVTHGITDLGDLNNWTYVSSGNRWTNSSIRDTIKKPASDSSTIDCKCNQLGYMSLTALRNSANDSLIAVGDSGILSVRYTTATAETINSLLSGVMLVYELATPNTIQLTPQQIEQLRGENNVFVDCGDIKSLTYLYKGTPEE